MGQVRSSERGWLIVSMHLEVHLRRRVLGVDDRLRPLHVEHDLLLPLPLLGELLLEERGALWRQEEQRLPVVGHRKRGGDENAKVSRTLLEWRQRIERPAALGPARVELLAREEDGDGARRTERVRREERPWPCRGHLLASRLRHARVADVIHNRLAKVQRRSHRRPDPEQALHDGEGPPEWSSLELERQRRVRLPGSSQRRARVVRVRKEV
mmetsp:Transcript_26806/g.79140  ORF Transcript_26806/g.79140 Transcript_26806/m.79140 type:complete len:212 (+) Transcript_26806:191-826(+)